MKKLLNRSFVTILAIISFYLIANSTSWGFFFNNLEGQYILHSDGNCHFLFYDTDTLLLKRDGSVISKNFPGNATYKIQTGFLEKQIELHFNAISGTGTASMTLPIERTLFGPTKFRICMDWHTYYYKI